MSAQKKITALLIRHERILIGRLNLSQKAIEHALFRFREEVTDVVMGHMYEMPQHQAEELVSYADQAVDRLEKALKRRP